MLPNTGSTSQNVRIPQFQLRRFPLEREIFLNNYLGNINFETDYTKANVLLLFEIARRRTDEDYLLNRKQTKEAIEQVMKSTGNAFNNKVIVFHKKFNKMLVRLSIKKKLPVLHKNLNKSCAPTVGTLPTFR